MPDNSNYQFRAVPLDLLSYVIKKQKSAKYYFRYLLDRTMMMFEYKGLPDTIPHEILERYLQVNGVAAITKAPDGKLYCFNGSWGGQQDIYYRPTKFIIANPHLSQLNDGTSNKTFTKECTIYGTEEHDAVLLRNDTEWASLTPLIARYAVLMCENCITVRSATIMLRCLALLSAGNDKEYKSALAYLAKLEAGELGAISSSSFSEGVKLQSPPSNNGSYLTQFIELQQYLKGSFFNELGLRANYNMKREAIGQGESTLDADSILPLCDNMLKCRREDMEKVNKLFGTDITVDFSSAWLENHLESSINIISQLNESGALQVGGSNELNAPEMDMPGAGAERFGEDGNVGSDGKITEMDGGETDDQGTKGNGTVATSGSNTSGKTGNADESDDDAGKVSERAGSETSASGESGEGRSDGSGGEGNGNKEEESGTRGEGGSGTEGTGETEDGEAGETCCKEIEEELESNELTFVEGAVEVVNNKISQLIADARKGDLDE